MSFYVVYTRKLEKQTFWQGSDEVVDIGLLACLDYRGFGFVVGGA